MPELPDVTIYVEALRDRVAGQRLERVLARSPFLLRSAAPPLEAAEGRQVREVRRVGKRIAIGLEGDLWLVLHLMIAGRLHWRKAAPKTVPNNVLALFQFSSGVLTLTEAGSERRAALHVAVGEEGLAALDAGGIDALNASEGMVAATLRSANHTLKRALTDPHLFSGIGNAYSDEILHRARLSPVALTLKLTDDEAGRLQQAVRDVLERWTDRLRAEAAGGFPEKVTAFREGMAVHGRYGQPCPDCGSKIQRIRYRANETNYCPQCQTGGRLLADRALSRLLREGWPRTIEELEALKKR
ncbi:MAG: DNA-formamidopyrimidine glycosylase family protein [Bryobacteraceae bacterium]|jgi:formamidopyrimidine-DNA glycosylase